MDFYKVPIGFGMALAMNPLALNAYSTMTEEQKQAILNKAHNARSEAEMGYGIFIENMLNQMGNLAE